MSTEWNGTDLQTDLSEQLGDTSTAFKTKVLGWMNEIQNDIVSRHSWPFLRFKGKKLLTASAEEHSLIYSVPGAPTVATASGGSLTAESTYKVLITFVDSNGAETRAGTESASVTPTGANLTISVSAIATSTEALVTKRRVYLDKDGAGFFLSQEIADNTTTTASITADTADSSTTPGPQEPPDYDFIRALDGHPFFEGNTSRQLIHKPVDQMRLVFPGTFPSGSVIYFDHLGFDKIATYPAISAAESVSFYYYRMPERIYASVNSQPEIPIWLKPVLNAGVLALGYEFRDRSGQESKRQNYENLLSRAISRMGTPVKVQTRVRDVVGDTQGFEY